MDYIYMTAFILLLSGVQSNPTGKKPDVALEFIILHNNDMHARFEQTSVNGGSCLKEDANTNKCYGGFARVAYEVRKHREAAQNGGQPVLYLNAGDTYTGTPWFTVFKDKIASAFLNKLMPNAVSLGNHEFDEGVNGLVPFLNNVEFPVVAANLDLKNAPELAATKHLVKHTILEVNSVKLGVIGYLTPDTQFIVKKNPVRFAPEIDAINEESARLKEKGINIIIALGHSGYQKDQEIAAKCKDVDIVIGGHSHSFLYSGKKPDAENPEGPYPTIVKRSNGVEVPVVQAYAYTKYLGKLHVQFDKEGNLIEFDGTPILLNGSVPRDDDMLQLLETFRPNITALENDIVGHTKAFLDGSDLICRREECNLGNLITDSMIYARILQDQGGAFWTDAPIALVGGGGIRGSIDLRSDGSILGSDILSVLPFQNELVLTKMYGRTLLQTLEHSASLYETDSNGGFLQMSGVKVKYDMSQKKGSRVVDVQVRCAECDVPHYEPLNKTRLYMAIVQQFLFEGGDGHRVQENNTLPIFLKITDAEALKSYLVQRAMIYPEIEGRIIVLNPKRSISTKMSASLLTMLYAVALRIFL